MTRLITPTAKGQNVKLSIRYVNDLCYACGITDDDKDKKAALLTKRGKVIAVQMKSFHAHGYG